jgi:hypothetical protein
VQGFGISAVEPSGSATRLLHKSDDRAIHCQMVITEFSMEEVKFIISFIKVNFWILYSCANPLDQGCPNVSTCGHMTSLYRLQAIELKHCDPVHLYKWLITPKKLLKVSYQTCCRL